MSSDLQLDEEKVFSRRTEVPQSSAFVRFILSTRLVKTEKQAEYMLLGVAGAGLIVTIIVSVIFLRGSNPPVNPYREGQSVLIYPRVNQSP